MSSVGIRMSSLGNHNKLIDRQIVWLSGIAWKHAISNHMEYKSSFGALSAWIAYIASWSESRETAQNFWVNSTDTTEQVWRSNDGHQRWCRAISRPNNWSFNSLTTGFVSLSPESESESATGCLTYHSIQWFRCLNASQSKRIQTNPMQSHSVHSFGHNTQRVHSFALFHAFNW